MNLDQQIDYDSFESEASFESDSLNGSDSVFVMGAEESVIGETEYENLDVVQENQLKEEFVEGIYDDFAKLRATLLWVLHKAYGNNIPPDFKEPFYETDGGSWLIKPILINALSSSDVYCHACKNIFPDAVVQRHGHASILQLLSRKSIYVTDSDDLTVSESNLQKTAPFHVKGHMALIYGLMTAYAADTTNIENVVRAVKRFATFNASSELPTTVQDSAVFWINKVCSVSQLASGHQLLQGETNQKVRIRSRTPVREPYPVINNLSEDIGDGSSLACLISFYCPKHLKFSDICLKENLGIADSLYNLRLVRTFCEKHLPHKCFHFAYEDLLYSTNKMRENILVLIAELFYLFELNPASCVQRSIQNDQENIEGRNGLPTVNSATKQSFQKPLADNNRSVNSPTFSSVDQDGRDSRVLLSNVSIDSEVHDSFSDTQIDLSDLDNSLTPRSPRPSRQTNLHDPNHPDYMEVESVTSNSSRSRITALPSNPLNQREPLTPARLKTPKERVGNHSKSEERGHGRKKVASPTKPKKKSILDAHSPVPEDMRVTPLPDDQLSWRSGESNESGKNDSFYMNLDTNGGSGDYLEDPGKPEVMSSYSVPDQVHTLHSARAAGIPVVDGAEEYRRFHSREGSVASSRSSGDFSDHESHKIHYDHKAREAQDLKTSSSPSGSSSNFSKPTTLLITDKLPSSSASIIDRSNKPNTTNFAEIKRLKEAYGGVDNSGLVYMQHNQDRSPIHNTSKSMFSAKHPDVTKKTTFAQLPNETTWQQSAQRSAGQNQNNSHDDGIDCPSQPLATELMSLRMKLDEKRKEIERKKHRSEIQQQKMRQRMGKAAFLQVVSKHIPEKDGSDSIAEEPESSHSQRLAADVRERLGQMSLPGQRSLLGESSSPSDAQRPTSLVDMPCSATDDKFSQDGIHNPIDNVKKKWIQEDEMSTSSHSLPERRDSNSDMRRDSYDDMSRSLTQSPVPGVQKRDSMEGSDHSSQGRGYSNPSFDEYGGSLDRLNHSLTQLQGEIAHLSLQHEQQMRSGKTPTESPRSSQNPQTLPRQAPSSFSPRSYKPDETSQTLPRSQWQVPESSSRPIGYTSTKLEAAQEGLPDCYSQSTGYSTPPLSTSYDDARFIQDSSLTHDLQDGAIDSPNSYNTPPRSTDGDDEASATGDASNEGFFVSFGEDTPKRPKPKPKLGLEKRVKRDKGRDESSPAPPTSHRDESPAPTTSHRDESPAPTTRREPERIPPPAEATSSPGQVPKDAPKSFVLDNQINSKEEFDMQQKRDKLKQLQVKRQEENERKKLEKEAENAKKKEAERLKQEEAERKKAEDKLRKEQIFQQYLQRKQEKEDEENGIRRPAAKSRPRTTGNENGVVSRRNTKTKARPKSMFVKTLDEPDSKSSSQDDLSTSGESGVPRSPMPRSTRLPTSRLPFPSNRMRKAVSCNTLNQNGAGGATYRRPASPDVYRTHRKSSREESDGYAGNQATGSDYSGPKLFVKPSSKSNRNLIINAISHCCLAGIVNNDVKNKVLEEIARSSAKHFIILFRDAGLQYRGLYTFEPETEEVFKLIGSGPRYIHNKSLEKYYKYNSGSKSFFEIVSTKHLSVSIDAIVPVSTVWKNSKPTPMRR